MTLSAKTLTHIRYGYGFRPDSPNISGAADLLGQLRGDTLPELPIGLAERRVLFDEFRTALRRQRNNDISKEDLKETYLKIDGLIVTDFKEALINQVTSHHGFMERLTAFWADHFTVSARGRRLGLLHSAFIRQAVRPHLAGRFADMLIASTTHPGMLVYLDQNSSIGPNSVIGKRRGRGLNENLAREILELHTLGVGSGYTQDDVREFAELLTGLRLSEDGVGYGARFAEPGEKTVLGISYDGASDGLATIKKALRNIALRPETARHIASKLVVHFIDDAADPNLVDHIARTFLRTDGDLFATYQAMLERSEAWAPELRKIKQPRGYIVSAMRAFGFDADFMQKLTLKEMRGGIYRPLIAMGQMPNRPLGPDGWPEEASAWITPATLAARIDWSTELARKFGQDIDPRRFLEMALGDAASANTRFLVAGSESKWEGVALALASPEFNRR